MVGPRQVGQGGQERAQAGGGGRDHGEARGGGGGGGGQGARRQLAVGPHGGVRHHHALHRAVGAGKSR